MKSVGRTMTAAVAGLLLGTLTACGSSGSGGHGAAAGQGASAATAASAAASGAAAAPTAPATGPGAATAAAGGAAGGAATGAAAGAATGAPPAPGAVPPGATAAPAGSGPAAGPAPTWSDAPTPLLDYKLVLQLMPDQSAMPGWEQEKRRVDLTDHSSTCQNTESCNGKPLSGEARFTSGDVTARFLVDTLPSKAAAQDKLKEAYAAFGDARYTPAELQVVGTESRAWQGRPGGRDGVGIVMRAGTVVASVTTEDGPVDAAMTQRLAVMLAKRIEQAQSGRTPDTVLAH
ncbi:hypothetical protein ACGFZP_21375 [Kitasatospora sp. NPDC048239]|uniref:hypothetical protein n=1 Tax=Kitasatospora sp. NPDC048239 TaxID=3364046 RepID=UPI003715130C